MRESVRERKRKREKERKRERDRDRERWLRDVVQREGHMGISPVR